MAVKVSQFFKRYQSDTIAFFLMAQLLLVMASGAVAWLLWRTLGVEPFTAFILSLGAFLILTSILASFTLAVISKPLKIISQAIAHVSKDPIQTPPPDINHRRYENTGLKAMVQTIYELAVTTQNHTEITGTTYVARYQTLFDNVPVGVIALDQSGDILFANPAAPVHTDADGALELELLFDQDNLANWFQTAQTHKVRDTKTWHWVPNRPPDQPERRIFDVVGYYNQAGQQGIEAIIITIDKTAEYAPTQDGMDFIALAAHELRGPITVIRGYLDLLDEDMHARLQPNQQELIDRLQVSAEQLSGYINNILNVSRYERNTLRLHLREEPLIDLIKDLVPDLALRAKTKKRHLTFHIPNDLPSMAADPSSLGEVLTNLIDNAIKYSKPEGEVIVTAATKDKMVEITVQDFGIGMPASIVGNLFTKFYRSHRSRQQVGGTGLGLYICKVIVQSHGGSIWVRSTEGEGTTFGFTIPIYSTVADMLAKGNNGNEQIIERSEGWIKNHAMYRR